MIEHKGLTLFKWYDTLGKSLPITEGKSGPPWAQLQFSYRFGGLPPLEVYELMAGANQSPDQTEVSDAEHQYNFDFDA